MPIYVRKSYAFKGPGGPPPPMMVSQNLPVGTPWFKIQERRLEHSQAELQILIFQIFFYTSRDKISFSEQPFMYYFPNECSIVGQFHLSLVA